jgi:hypothetical protein
LPEIGEAGQERLGAREVTTESTTADAREIEVAYLRAAGVRVRDVEPKLKASTTAKAQLDALALGDPAARDVAEGALRALCAMRALIGLGEAAPPGEPG